MRNNRYDFINNNFCIPKFRIRVANLEEACNKSAIKNDDLCFRFPKFLDRLTFHSCRAFPNPLGMSNSTPIKNIKGITSAKPDAVGLSSALPAPMSKGSDIALTLPIMKAAMITPGIEVIDPNTITANAGNNNDKPSSGLTGKIAANRAPPKPETPADKKELVEWIFSTFIPLVEAKSGLSETALIFFPRIVLCIISINKEIAIRIPTTKAIFE